MDLQTSLVTIAALVAVAYLGRCVWKTWTSSGCGGGCGCGPKTDRVEKLIRTDELLLRVREDNEKGARSKSDFNGRHNSENFSA